MWTTTWTPLASAASSGRGGENTKLAGNAGVFSPKFCLEFCARSPLYHLPVLTSHWLPCNDCLGAKTTGMQRFDEL